MWTQELGTCGRGVHPPALVDWQFLRRISGTHRQAVKPEPYILNDHIFTSTQSVDNPVHKLCIICHPRSFIHRPFILLRTFNHCVLEKNLYKIYGEGIPQVTLRM